MFSIRCLFFSRLGVIERWMFDVGRSSLEASMAELSLEKVSDLLGTQKLPGSENELKILCVRIRELVEMNGEDWVRQNCKKLLDEWDYIIQQKIIT